MANREIQTANLFDDLPTGGADEDVTTLLGASGARLVRIVSTGQATPDGEWYDQDDNEWVVVLRGSPGSGSKARTTFEYCQRGITSTFRPVSATASSGPTPTSRQSGWRFTTDESTYRGSRPVRISGGLPTAGICRQEIERR